MNATKKTILYDFHAKVLKAKKFQCFANFLMPIEYQDYGMMQESLLVRKQAGFFDIGHMKQVMIHGNDAWQLIQYSLTADINNKQVGDSQLTLLLNEKGGIVDDLVVSKFANQFGLVLNASSAQQVIDILTKHKNIQIQCIDDSSLISIQGPQAYQMLFKMGLAKIDTISFMQFTEQNNMIIYRSGYTGEDGLEILIPNKYIEEFCKELFASNKELIPCGLGARDILRLEAGLCLSGQDFNENITPSEAKLKWLLKNSNNFYLKHQQSDSACILNNERRSIQHDSKILNSAKEEIGFVTSGTFSPYLQKGIGMGYIKREFLQKNQDVFLYQGQRVVPAKIVALPFVPHNYKRSFTKQQ